MKNKRIKILAGGLAMSMVLCACGQEPQDLIVREKGAIQNVAADTKTEAATAVVNEVDTNKEEEKAASPLFQTLGAETHLTSSATYDKGLQVHVDAEVELPDVSTIPTYAVAAHPFDQEWIDKVTDTFLQGGKIYDTSEYMSPTKAECKEKLDKIKEALEAGNMDPYNMGKDEDGEYRVDINEVIANLEKEYQEAPEEKKYVEVTPSLGDAAAGEGYFAGMVEMPDGGLYNYILKEDQGMDIRIQRKDKVEEKKSLYSYDYVWADYGMLAGSHQEQDAPLPSEEEVKDRAGISYEEAKKAADEKVQALGIPEMGVGCSDYALKRINVSENPDNVEMKVIDAGYHFIYERKVDGTPIISTMREGGNALDMTEDTTKPWVYEKLELIVNGDGIQQVDMSSIYDIGNKIEETTSLLGFSKIMEIFNNMMPVVYEGAMPNLVEDIYSIDRITLGYMRIYQPDAGDQTGTLIPVWDFFGSQSAKVAEDGKETQWNVNYTNQSYLTINAVDGTVIDRGFGY